MELDDLKPALKAFDERSGQRLDMHLAQIVLREKATSRLRPLKFWLAVQMLAGVVLTFAFASYWTGHREQPALMLSGIVMHAYSVLLIVFGAIELSMANRVDYAAPVVAIQKQLAQLRAWRIRTQAWLGFPHWILWIPLTLIAFDVLFGVDLYAHAPEVVASFFAVGIAGLALTLWFMRWARQPARQRIGAFLDDSAAGGSLRKAQAFMDEIARFENE
jgi:hypothetical protein